MEPPKSTLTVVNGVGGGNNDRNSMKKRRSSITCAVRDSLGGGSFFDTKSANLLSSVLSSQAKQQSQGQGSIRKVIPPHQTPLTRRLFSSSSDAGTEPRTAPRTGPGPSRSKPGKSMIPTPTQSSTVRPRSGSASSSRAAFGSSIPKSKPLTAASTRNVSKTVSKPNANNGALSVQQNRSRANTLSSTTISQRTRLRRSMSSESVNWNSTYGTPSHYGMTTSRLFQTSTRKAAFITKSAESLNRILGNEPIFKTLKVPSSTEKKTVNMLVMLIIEFLQETGYHKLYTLKDFHSISGLEYFKICQYVLELINFRVIQVVAPCKQQDAKIKQDPKTKSDEEKKKQDQLIDALILAASTLKYPGQITKSALKSINAPHSWPATVTLLVWTCARVEIILTPRSFGGKLNNVAALGGDQDMTFGDLYSEVYRRMYLKAIAGEDQNLEVEKDMFRQNMMENLLLSTDESISSLEGILAQREAELATKEAVLDPTASILANINFSTEKHQKAITKQADLQNYLYKYKNSDHVKCQIEMLRKRVTIESNILQQTSERVKNQPLSLEGKKEALGEVEQLKKQQHALAQVIEKMEIRLHNREQSSRNFRDRLYKFCERFRAVDDFNDSLAQLEQFRLVENMERLTRNPFNPSELENWIKESSRILRHADRILVELKHSMMERKNHVTLKSENTLENIEKTQQNYKDTEVEIGEIRREAAKKRAILKMNEHQIAQKTAELQKELKLLMNQLQEEESEYQLLLAEQDAATRRYAELEAQLKKLDDEVEETYLNGQLQRMKLEKDAMKRMKDFVQLKREEFFARHNYDILPHWGPMHQ